LELAFAAGTGLSVDMSRRVSIVEKPCFVYSAVGEGYIWQACLSAKSLKAVMPDVRVQLFCDQNVQCEYFDGTSRIYFDERFNDSIKRTKATKIRSLIDTEFDRFMYVDCDTYFAHSIIPTFQLLSRYELALCLDPWQYVDGETAFYYPVYGSGIMLIRKSKAIKSLLSRWYNCYLRTSPLQDQYCLRALLAGSSIRVFVLPNEMNVRCASPSQVSAQAMILHRGHRPEWRKNLAVLARFINHYSGYRIYLPEEEKMIVTKEGNSREEVVISEAYNHGGVAEQFMNVHYLIEPYGKELRQVQGTESGSTIEQVSEDLPREAGSED
jgi:hypothetical protein